VERATQRIAQERGKSASFRAQGSLEVAPWWNRGPTERHVGVAEDGQLVIARPGDLSRVLAVAAALEQRHASEPGMEHRTGPAALLAMYEGEAAALSVEGVRSFVAAYRGAARAAPPHAEESFAPLSSPSDDSPHSSLSGKVLPGSIPTGLRLSLRHRDEFHAELRAFGYFESPGDAARAATELDALRREFVAHPQAQYLGLQAAIAEATVRPERDTVILDALLTMHQVRYLLGFVSRTLSPRNPPR
jgi:hypothetical protein